jgi:hypothetical protein
MVVAAAGAVRSDQHVVHNPELAVLRQWLGAKHIETRTATSCARVTNEKAMAIIASKRLWRIVMSINPDACFFHQFGP